MKNGVNTMTNLEIITKVSILVQAIAITKLIELEKENKVRRGDKLLLFMAGFGLNWQAVILEKV